MTNMLEYRRLAFRTLIGLLAASGMGMALTAVFGGSILMHSISYGGYSSPTYTSSLPSPLRTLGGGASPGFWTSTDGWSEAQISLMILALTGALIVTI